ncbi:MAG: DUF3237 domain-containing protein [Burkholderiales bacterium]
MRHIAIAVTVVVALCGWTLHAAAQTSQIKTEYLMTFLAPISAQRIKIDGATSITAVYPGGWVKGPAISGKLVGPGGDWITITPAGVARLDARIVIETDDGALIYMTYGGISVSSKEVGEALGRGEVVTDKTFPYLVTAPTFRTSSEKYDWLNKVQAVGKMVEIKRGGEDSYIKYDVFILR